MIFDKSVVHSRAVGPQAGVAAEARRVGRGQPPLDLPLQAGPVVGEVVLVEDLLLELPPHLLDRVGPRGVRRQPRQPDRTARRPPDRRASAPARRTAATLAA